MANEVVITIKAKNQAAPVLKRAQQQVGELGDEAKGTAKKIDDMGSAEKRTTRRTAEMGAAAKETSRQVDNQGDKVERLQRRLTLLSFRKYKVEVEVDRDGALSNSFEKIGGKLTGLVTTAGEAAEKIGKQFVDILPGAIGGAFSAAGPIVQTAMVVIGGIIVAALAAFIAAALGGAILAVLGGGVVAAGIAGALKNDKIDELLNGKKVITRSALNKKGDKTPNTGADVETRVGGIIPKVKDTFTAFSTPFVEPLMRALDQVDKILDRIQPKAQALGEKFAPLADKLLPALITMGEKAWPGIEAGLDASLPILTDLANLLPAIGQAISLFFQTIADHGPEAEGGFRNLVGVIGTLIIAIASMLGWLMSAYGGFVKLKNALEGSWVGSLFMGPINAISRLITLLDNALNKKHELEGSSGQARVLGNGPPAGIATGALRRASGGIAGGLTHVAERGGELLKLPQGTMVYAHGQSNQMMANMGGGGGASRVAVDINIRGNSALAELVSEGTRTGDIQIHAKSIV